MKKHLFAFAVLAFFGHPGFAQPAKTDSLQILLKKDKEDTSKVNHLNELAWELIYINTDTSIRLSTEALELAERQNWKKGIANSSFRIAACKYLKAEYTVAIEWGDKALALYDKLNDITGKGRTLNIVGLAYSNKGDYSRALDCYMRALKMDEEAGEKNGICSVLGNIGIIFLNQGDYSKALDYYLKALKIAEELENKNLIANHLGNIGLVYDNQHDYSKALDYYFKALKLNEELGNKIRVATNLGNIGLIYYNQRNYSNALEHYLKALKIEEETGNKSGMARHLGNIGELYYDQSDYSKALDYYSKALNMAEDVGDKYLSIFWLGSIGKVYTKTGKFTKGEARLKKAIVVADSLGLKDHLRQFEETLSQLYDTTGRHDLALIHYKRAMVLKDTLFNQEKNKEITRKEMNYEFDKKEAAAKAAQDKKDALAQKELQRQKFVRNAFVGGFAVMLLFTGIFFTQRNKIKTGKKRSDELLLNILPSEVAEELKIKGNAEAKLFEEVTVMFTDFKNFTQISEKLSPAELVAEIDYCFKTFDNIITKHNIEKIKTIGDSYMCAGGLPVVNKTNATDVVSAALEIRQFISDYVQKRIREEKEPFEIRIGVHTGPVVAGIVGVKKFAYDIWGDTVNVASRMESSGEAGRINISGSTYALVKDKFSCFYRGKIKAKNKGEIDMYFVENT